jgi:hypothetical protein
MIMGWVILSGCFKDTGPFQLKEYPLQPLPALPILGDPEIHCHARGMDGSGGRITGLTAEGSGEAGHDQSLPTGRSILGTQSGQEQLDLRTGIGM